MALPFVLGAPLVLLLVGVLAGGKKSDPAPTPNPGPEPGPTPTPNPSTPQPGPAETAACEAVALARPTEYLGRTRPADLDEASWLARVAYWQTYPDGPPDPAPDDTVWRPAIERLRSCIAARLAANPNPAPAPNPTPTPTPTPTDPNNPGEIKNPIPPVKPVPKPNIPPLIQVPDAKITPTPTPGSYYQIKGKDNLSKVASEAYGNAQGTPENFPRMVLINQAPYNQRFVCVDAADVLFPNGRISFNPRFGATFAEQQADALKGGEDNKNSNAYAVIWIPPK